MKAIIFDMYGVIMKAPEGDLIPFLRSKCPEISDELINDFWKEAALGQKSSQEFFRSIGCTVNIKEIEEEYLDTIEIDEAFFDIVHDLKKEYKLVLLSNDISEWSVFLRRKYGLDELFDEILISGDIGFLKPDIRIFHNILERLGMTPTMCYYIDDREKNLYAASQLGMRGILFNRRNVTYVGNKINNFYELKNFIK